MTNEELIAKIKAEIERQRKFIEGMFVEGDNNFYDGQDDAYNNILTFLSTLESEKPIDGLDVTDFCKPIDPGIAQCIADHSWEMLGEDEKPVPNDLEEAADHHICKAVDAVKRRGWNLETQDITDAFIAGAKWQKEQMMKEAVKWLVDDGYDELTDKGRFILGSVGIGYNGYYIPYSDLLKLPNED